MRFVRTAMQKLFMKSELDCIATRRLLRGRGAKLIRGRRGVALRNYDIQSVEMLFIHCQEEHKYGA